MSVGEGAGDAQSVQRNDSWSVPRECPVRAGPARIVLSNNGAKIPASRSPPVPQPPGATKTNKAAARPHHEPRPRDRDKLFLPLDASATSVRPRDARHRITPATIMRTVSDLDPARPSVRMVASCPPDQSEGSRCATIGGESPASAGGASWTTVGTIPGPRTPGPPRRTQGQMGLSCHTTWRPALCRSSLRRRHGSSARQHRSWDDTTNGAMVASSHAPSLSLDALPCFLIVERQQLHHRNVVVLRGSVRVAPSRAPCLSLDASPCFWLGFESRPLSKNDLVSC